MHLFGRKEKFVARSVSVLLPVKNAQSTLAPTVHKILDIVSEISEQIELLIIDDGSVDATSEVAMELTRRYPQVQAICQSRSLGKEAAIRSALHKSTGEIALIYEEEWGTPLDEIAKALKSSTPLGQFFFRLDAPKGPSKVMPVQSDRSAVDRDFSEHPYERQSPTSSRPARPNFLERLKNIVLGE
jgi:glycosyltransferase involved in cell wall biosynthesis